MSGRGDNRDNNKHNTSGQGSSNQDFVADNEKQKKYGHNKNITGGQPSKQQEKTSDQSSNRNISVNNAKE